MHLFSHSPTLLKQSANKRHCLACPSKSEPCAWQYMRYLRQNMQSTLHMRLTQARTWQRANSTPPSMAVTSRTKKLNTAARGVAACAQPRSEQA